MLRMRRPGAELTVFLVSFFREYNRLKASFPPTGTNNLDWFPVVCILF